MSVYQTTFKDMEALAKRHPEILVAFSGGKDSLAVLDICCRTFPKVKAFFKYLVPGLDVLDAKFRWAQERYGIETIQFPANSAIRCKAQGVYCDADFNVMKALGDGKIPLKASFEYAMQVTGCPVMATGMKEADGMKRRQLFANIRDGKDAFWGKVVHPLRWWNKRDVITYLKAQNIPLPDAENGAVTSGVGLDHGSLCWLHDRYPEDFQKLLRWYPFAGAAIKRREWFGVNAKVENDDDEKTKEDRQ